MFSREIEIIIENIEVNENYYQFKYTVLFRGYTVEGYIDSKYTVDRNEIVELIKEGGYAEELVLDTIRLSDYKTWRKI